MTLADKGPVRSVERAFKVLEFLSQSRRGFSISELSRKLAIPKSSLHLLVTTLAARDYLRKSAVNGRYCFGLKLVSLGNAALENLDLREVARPCLYSLMQRTALTVHMAVLDHNEAVIIERFEAPGPPVSTWIGRRLDVNCTGVGKALVAFIPEEEFRQQCRAKLLAKHNENTIASLAKLKRELDRVRQMGYAFDDEEDEIGSRCVGAPILDANRRAVAAISVSGSPAQIPADSLHELGRIVMRSAADISVRMAPPA